MVEEAEEEDILEQTITLQCKYKILISIFSYFCNPLFYNS